MSRLTGQKGFELVESVRPDSLLFGESTSRIILSCNRESVDHILSRCNEDGIPAEKIGTTGGDRLRINQLIDLPLQSLSDSYYHALPRIMERVG